MFQYPQHERTGIKQMTHFRCVAIRNVVAIFEQILFESSTSRTRLPKGAGHEGG